VIGRLTGSIVEQAPDGACVVDVLGVGYEVFVPLGALGRLPGAPERVTLFVHTQVREDAITLYGFPSGEERAAFRTLTSVTGIGPKLALGILSSMTVGELARAVQHDDKGAFKGVSGVGKKLVERLVLELKDKLPLAGGGGAVLPLVAKPKPSAAPAFSGALGAVHGALVQMGYKPVEAEQAVQRLVTDAEGKSAEQLLREALVALA
jgi:holliday junction DNA helicase RuvA